MIIRISSEGQEITKFNFDNAATVCGSKLKRKIITKHKNYYTVSVFELCTSHLHNQIIGLIRLFTSCGIWSAPPTTLFKHCASVNGEILMWIRPSRLGRIRSRVYIIDHIINICLTTVYRRQLNPLTRIRTKVRITDDYFIGAITLSLSWKHQLVILK